MNRIAERLSDKRPREQYVFDRFELTEIINELDALQFSLDGLRVAHKLLKEKFDQLDEIVNGEFNGWLADVRYHCGGEADGIDARALFNDGVSAEEAAQLVIDGLDDERQRRSLPR